MFISCHEATPGWLPETILQLMVIGWNDFPGESAGLGGCPCETILQLAVMGWKAEFPWDPRVTLSLALGRVGVRSTAVRVELCAPACLPISVLITAVRRIIILHLFIERNKTTAAEWQAQGPVAAQAGWVEDINISD